jgi:tetratricopeptide (TPR) repeat protein/DNA-binding winged helix-turn-helix (wHTH) protein
MDWLDGRVYRLGEFEIDPAKSCLRRNGQEQYLRQMTFHVLLYLIEQRERLVSKDELFEKVWRGVAVTDDALVKCVVEIRKALGDDPHQPRFIKTVSRAGYRLIAQVEEIKLKATIHSAPNLAPAELSAIEVEEVTTVKVEVEEVEETEKWGDRAMGRRGGGVRAALTSANRPAVVVSTLAITVMAILGAFASSRFLVPKPAPVEVALPNVPGKRAVAALYFENQTGDSELNWLREGLADMLIANLSRSGRLTVLSRQQLAVLLDHIGRRDAAKIGLEEGLEIGRRARAEALILGSFARIGEKVRIDVTLRDARTGQIQTAETLIAERPELILTQIDLLSHKLAEHLGVAGAAPRDPAAMSTNNLDAYRYYSLALEQTQMFQFHEAIALLEKALALDPRFAMAHARIGYVYAVRMGQGDKARPYLEKALALADRLSEKDKLFISAWLANAARDRARAIEVYRDLTARYPMETEAYQRLNWLLQTQNRNEEALAVIRQGLLTDLESKDLYNALGSVCMRLGRNEEALAAYQRYIQLAPNDPNAWDSLGEFHQWLGQYGEAETAYDRALALNPESGVAIIHLGNLRFQQGRYRAASEQFRRFSQIARDDNGRARGFDRQAWIYLKQGDFERAAAAINEAVKRNPASLWNSLVLAFARRDQTAIARLSEEYFTPAAYDSLNERGFLRIWEYERGTVALRQGRAEEAVNHFRAALRHRPVEWNIDSFEDCLANAYLELGRLNEAIAEYERILRINPNYSLVQYHLAQAYEGKGDRERARAAYRSFLQIWKDADSDIPEVIEAKRRID